MRFLLDENVGKKVANYLRLQEHFVLRIKEISPGVDDYEVLNLALSNNSVLVTSDKDFGELIFREEQPHSGVIFLRLKDETSDNKIKAMKLVLKKFKKIEGNFIVVSGKDGNFKLRLRRTK